MRLISETSEKRMDRKQAGQNLENVFNEAAERLAKILIMQVEESKKSY